MAVAVLIGCTKPLSDTLGIDFSTDRSVSHLAAKSIARTCSLPFALAPLA
jgi:hypothetical protein